MSDALAGTPDYNGNLVHTGASAHGNFVYVDTAAQAETVTALVEDKYHQALDYANNAWTISNDELSKLGDLFYNPIIIDIPIPPLPIIDSLDVSINAVFPPEPIIQFSMPIPPARPSFSIFTGKIENVTVPELIESLLQIPSNDMTVFGYILDAWNLLIVEDFSIDTIEWENALSRLELDQINKYNQIDTYFSSRGWNIPQGAQSARLNELTIEILRNNLLINKELTVEAAKLNMNKDLDLANKRIQLADISSKAGLAVVDNYNRSIINKFNSYIDLYGKNIQKALSVVQFELEEVNSYNKSVLDAFLGDVELYKTNIQAEVSRIDSIVKIYISQIEAYKADIQGQSTIVDAKIRQVESQVKELVALSDILIKKANLEIEQATKVFAIQVEVIKASAQISSQLAASALAGVNVSVSSGMSGSIGVSGSLNENTSYDQTKSVQSNSFIEQHTYDETK